MLAKDYLQEKFRKLKRSVENAQYLVDYTETLFIEKGSDLSKLIQENVDQIEYDLKVIQRASARVQGESDDV